MTLNKIAGSQTIGFDCRMTYHSGIGRYIRGTLTNLFNQTCRYQSLLIGPKQLSQTFPNQPLKECNIPIYGCREQVQIPIAAKDCVILHVPHYNAPLFWPKKLVVTIHDLIHLHFPDHLPSFFARWYARVLLPWITERADAIIAVSEFTKQDLIKTLNVKPEKITVIHHGIDSSFIDSKNQKQANRELYFLYVGVIKHHKNVGLLLDAFQQIKKEANFPNLKLYLAGAPDLKQPKVRRWMETIRTNPDIVLIDEINDAILKTLYSNATGLILPSLYEGFGFPLIEAMACGTPVIASHVASLPEVAGEKAALFFDPYSVKDLQKCMRQILSDAQLRTQLTSAGYERLKCYDWKTAAEKTLKVYESILGSN